VVPGLLIVREVAVCCFVRVQLSDVHQSVAKMLQDAVVIRYLGFAGRQSPEFLQLKTIEF
jgi:hypothetical protein